MNAHLLSHAPGYRAAGIHSYISNLLSHLPAAVDDDWRFEAHVGAANAAAFAGIHMARANSDTSSAWRRIIWEQTQQPRELRGVDLYHAMAFVAPLILPAPMVVTVYDLSFIRYPGRISPARRHYLRAMTRLTCKRARRVIAISQSTADDLQREMGVPARKIDVTPLGYDQALFRQRQPAEIEHFRRKHSLPARFWLFVGTLEPRKNLMLLLEAYRLLDKAERLPLILGGGLGWRGEQILAAIEQFELGDSVKHVGFIPVADLPLWYNCAEAFLYPSVYEGFGLPVLEAMACGTPVIASDAAALAEVVGRAGLCIAPDDLARWAAALQAVREEDEWRETVGEYATREARRYSWQRTALLTARSYLYAILDKDPPPLEGREDASDARE
ncbi:MAG: glycosyltransferase family 1 protein [Chloroflexi bacterium]|nr:glycosyltransferase family 1 protein [Chloroflexota bacterium]